MSVLLDTNVLSELARPDPNSKVVEFCSSLLNASISEITLHELLYGAKLVKAASKRNRLLDWIDELQQQYHESMVSISPAIAARAATIRAEASKKGVAVHIEDAMIAATCLEHSLTLATRNLKDFMATKVVLINPWEAE